MNNFSKGAADKARSVFDDPKFVAGVNAVFEEKTSSIAIVDAVPPRLRTIVPSSEKPTSAGRQTTCKYR